MNIGWAVAIAVIAFLLGNNLGWNYAHLTIATECKRLGKFYVKKEVFECVLIKSKDKK